MNTILALCLISAPFFDDPIPAPLRLVGNFSRVTVLSQNPEIAKELKLTDAQSKSVRELVDKIMARSRSYYVLRRERDHGVFPKKDPYFNDFMVNELTNELKPVLDKPQLDRLIQISIQVEGVSAFGAPPIWSALELTADQDMEVQSIRKRAEKEFDDYLSFSENRRDRIKIRTVHDDIHLRAIDEILKTLSPTQQQKWKTLIGTPFKLSVPVSK